jgi:hypothetical protein
VIRFMGKGATMRSVIRRVLFGVLFAATVLSFTGNPANAEFMGQIVTVSATCDQGSTSQSWAIPDLADATGDQVKWLLPERVQLLGPGGRLIGTIEDLTVELNGDPLVNVDFSVSAGNTATTFVISSAVVSFWPLEDVTGFASAAVTLTDGSPLPGNGASLSLAPGWTGLYRATYNGSSTFAELLSAQNIGGAGTISSSTDTGAVAIPGLVSSIEAAYSFRLSAKDYASGTSQFEVVGTTSDIPEPSVLAMLGLGLAALLVGLRRR